jgi:hypothetical protein
MQAQRQTFDFDAIRVGELLGRRRIEISAQTIGTCAGAIEATREWYASGSPFGCPVAPPTVFDNETLRMLDECYDRFGSIHAQQSWEFLGPVRRGETVEVDVKVVDKYVKRGGQYIVMELTVTGAAGTPLCRGRHTSLMSLRKE